MLLAPPRSFRENLFLASAFSAIAGGLNAGGFFALGVYTSHVTGHWSRMCDNVATSDWIEAAEFLAFALSYLSGSVVAAYLIGSRLERSRRVRLFRPLVLELFLLAVFVSVGLLLGAKEGRIPGLLTAMLCFTMGLQNATTTLMSSVALRTTHMTGMTTDLGIELSRLWLLARDRYALAVLSAKELPFLAGAPPSLRGEITTIVLSHESEKARLQVAILGFFALGGIGGAIGFFRFGYFGAIPIAALLLVLVWNELRAIREEGGLAALEPPQSPASRRPPRARVVTELGTIPLPEETPVAASTRVAAPAAVTALKFETPVSATRPASAPASPGPESSPATEGPRA